MSKAAALASATSGKVSSAGSMAREAGDQIKNLVDTGADRATEVKDRIREKLVDAKDRLVDASGTVKDKLVDAKDKVVDRAGPAAASLRDLIREHPYAAVGIALGVGYLAMRLIRR